MAIINYFGVLFSTFRHFVHLKLKLQYYWFYLKVTFHGCGTKSKLVCTGLPSMTLTIPTNTKNES